MYISIHIYSGVVSTPYFFLISVQSGSSMIMIQINNKSDNEISQLCELFLSVTEYYCFIKMLM